MTRADPYWPRADTWLAGDSDHPDLLVVGVPSSAASISSSRADLAPLVMRERLSRFSTFHGETTADLAAVAVRDLGNWPVAPLGMEEVPTAVMELASSLPTSDLVIFLGGDNAVTRPLVASLGDLGKLGVITFDAHHDVRSLENGPTNGTPIRGLIEEEGLPGGNVVQIGIHSFANSAPYRAYCEDQGISVVTVADVEGTGMTAVVDGAFDRLAGCDRVYVDVDIDVLDRALAPGCPGSRPGGLTVRHLAEGVLRCAANPKVVAMDFVEVDPEADIGFLTVDTMAHLFLTAAAGLATRN